MEGEVEVKKYVCMTLMILFMITSTAYAGSYINPDDYNIAKDGATDCTSAWQDLDGTIADGSTIILPDGANYYVNSSGGITFTKRIHILGSGAVFTTGSSVGNNPTLTFSADGSILENFKVNGYSNHTDGNDDDFTDSVDSLTLNFRSGIRITGDRVVCKSLTLSDCVAGISFITGNNGKVHDCYFNNSIIGSATSAANNYHAAIYIKNSNKVKITNNSIVGHGQGVLISESFNSIVESNDINGASNNGIYLSSGGDSSIANNDIENFDSSGIKCRDSGNRIIGNRVQCSVSGGALSGIAITGNGFDEGDGFNGRDVVVADNIITGDAVAGISVGMEDDSYLKDPQIINNSIRFNTLPTMSCYGIHFSSAASDGTIIKANKVSGGHSFGVLMTVAQGMYHDHAIITNNIVVGGSNDAFSFASLRNSIVANNIGKNCAIARSGIFLNNSTNNKILHNDFGDDQEIATQKYGIEEFGTSTLNWYIYNNTHGVTKYQYDDIDLDSKIVDIDPSNNQ